ncbi:MAG: response regulator [Elusimicrobia bacterium]|nr:response regulator [Elusimicrobiota bacterium]
MSKRILVVDDEELVRNYVTRALLSRGYDVITAVDGASAVAIIEKEDFDLAICDLKMPDLRGEEVIRRLKVRRPLTSVIVITGSVSDISNPILPMLSVDGFLIKPFGINEVREMVEKILKAK